jgi:glycine cleavage system H protein
MSIPKNLKYSKTHEWVRMDGEVATVGITAHAQDTLGDITFVELPRPGTKLTQGGDAGVIESVKAASDLLSPVTGETLAANDTLAAAPEQINDDPYGTGWLYTVKPANMAELDGLLDAVAYGKFLETEA